MSIAKRLHEERTIPASWRAVVVSPSRWTWTGGRWAARCTECRWAMENQPFEKIRESCPRCGARCRILEEK